MTPQQAIAVERAVDAQRLPPTGPALQPSGPQLSAAAIVQGPGSVGELARALKNDPDLIYEYVYNNIDFVPTYGQYKGSLGTILDGKGDAFDQAELMAELLQQAGFTVNIVQGTIALNGSQLSNWLGVTNDANVLNTAGQFLTNVGIPVSQVGSTLQLTHFWVSVTIGGTNYVFDPAFKTYTYTTGINLATATGYNQASLLSSAESGATITSNSIQNINSANLQSKLSTYANSLLTYIRTNLPTAQLADVIGGHSIAPLSGPVRQTSLPYQVSVTRQFSVSSIPASLKSTLQVQLPGINKTFNSDQIYGQRLTITYNSSMQPVLALNGTVQATGTATTSGSPQTVTYTITHAFNSGNQSGNQTIIACSTCTYLVTNGWDGSSRGMVDYHRQLLAQNNAATGATPGSEPVLGEALAVIAHSWVAETTQSNQIADQVANTTTVIQHVVGIVGYKAVGSNTGVYTDLPFSTAVIASKVNDPSFAYFHRQVYIIGGHASAFEYGAVQQNMASNGVSMVKLFDIANTQFQSSGQNKFYDANSSNFSSISPNLVGYAAGDLTTIQNLINAGHRVILPQHGNLSQGTFSGDAYMDINSSSSASGSIGIGYIIAGGLKGGSSTDNITAQPIEQTTTTFTVTGVATIDPSAAGYDPNSTYILKTSEPINLFTGDYLYDHTDLSIGSAAFPYALSLQRSYTSGQRLKPGPLGLGWTHNFLVSAQPNSDGFQGLGESSGLSAATTIAEIYVTYQLMILQSGETQIPLDRLMVASLSQRWFMDQLINNAVQVVQPRNTQQFIKLADGTFNPPLGSSDRLTLSSGLYTLTTKNGVTLNFNSASNLATWQSPAGVTVTLTYDTSSPPKLTSVTNGLGRTLTFTYNGSNQITQVSDGNGRTAAYAYDTSGNLSSYTDATSKVTTYSYDIPGRLAQIFYPSFPSTAAVTNTYDSLGRIMTQANANNGPGNNTTWTYFFAGYRSEEVDPFGTRHVVYNNPRGKTLRDILDLAGLDRVTTYAYDGLDRLISVTAPEGNSVSYTYITATNPWANNVGTVTQTPKSGSPLSALTTTYTYDATFNKPTSITDPKGIVTTLSYNGTTGTLTSTVADSGSAPHLNATTSYTYNSRGQVLTATNPVGTVTQYSYDASTEKLLTVTIDPGASPHLNITASFGYDAPGNVTSKTDPNSNTTTVSYDAMRRVLTVTAPIAGISTTFTYDADGRVTQTSRQNGGTPQVSSATYSPTGKTLTATDPNSHVTTYTYDLLDRLATVTDAENRVTSTSYDVLSRLTAVTNTAIQSSPLLQQGYTVNGRLASITDALGRVTTYAYDGVDRPSTTTYPGSSTELLAYDADSNVTSFTTRAGAVIQFGYDNLNRRTSKTPPSPAPVVSYSYDLAARLTGVSDTSAAIPTVLVPGGGGGVQYTSYFYYDALNRLSGTIFDTVNAVTAPASSSTVFNHWYNKVNQRIYQTASSNAFWSYPTAAASSVSYSANSLNQYTAVGSATPTYDANGNLTFDGTFTYGYDAENRLISASGAGNTVSYAYDAMGRRKSKTVNGTTTLYLSDGDREVLEVDGGGNVLRRYTHGAGIDEVLNLVSVSGSRALLVPDIQGSLVASVDSGSGTVTAQGVRAFGESADSSGSFRYTGRRIDAETLGLYYYRARMYNPTLGRFMQPDPIGYRGGANLYAYVGNDPLDLTDGSGKCPQCVVGFIGGFVGGIVYRAAVDIYNRELSSGRTYFVSGLSSGIGGLTTAATGNPFLGGAAASLAENELNGRTAPREVLPDAVMAGLIASTMDGYFAGTVPTLGTRGARGASSGVSGQIANEAMGEVIGDVTESIVRGDGSEENAGGEPTVTQSPSGTRPPSSNSVPLGQSGDGLGSTSSPSEGAPSCKKGTC
jgi:RHS repeat-associated protein